MERDYTNGELGLLLENIKESLNGFIGENKEAHKKLQEAQAYTNGTVKKHEKVLSYLKGAWAVISIILLAIIVPLLNNYLSTRDTVRQQVDEALGVYLEKQ